MTYVQKAYLAGCKTAEREFDVHRGTDQPPPPWAQSWQEAESKTKKKVTIPSCRECPAK